MYYTRALTANKLLGKYTSFISPEGGRAATDGKIRDGSDDDGCGRKVLGTVGLILTQHYL
jgi:hypothetical protein